MIWALLAVAVVAAGCKDHREPSKAVPSKPVSKLGTVKLPRVESVYGVAVGTGADVAALKKTAPDAIEMKFADFFNDSQFFVATRGLKPEEAARLKSATTVLVLRSDGTDGLKVTRELATTVHRLAEAAHGWVLDPQAMLAFPADEFAKHIPGDHPDIRKLISVHAVGGDNEQPFLDTAGMPRYGFPELYVAEVGAGQVDGTMLLINGAAQTLLERGIGDDGRISVDYKALGWDVQIVDGSTGKATLTARWAIEPDAAHDDAQVLELVPAAGPTPQGWAKTINDCFGSEPEQIVRLRNDDPELLEAATKARADLLKLRAHFKTGVPYNERLVVKAKFSSPDGTVEWMWVGVVAFKGNLLSGTLENEPELIRTLRLGEKVTVNLSDLADYLHYLPDGSSTGGYSVAIMKQRGLLSTE